MENNDTIELLKECDAGSKMAVSAIDEVKDKVRDPQLLSLLTESRGHHESLGNEIHAQLLSHGSEGKDPNLIAESMSWMKTNMKMGMAEECDAAAADLITDGCNMGIKSLFRYRNQYKAADDTAKHLCSRLIEIEEKLRMDLREYL